MRPEAYVSMLASCRESSLDNSSVGVVPLGKPVAEDKLRSFKKVNVYWNVSFCKLSFHGYGYGTSTISRSSGKPMDFHSYIQLQTEPLPPADRPVHRVRWSLMVWPLLRDLQSGSSPVCSYKFNAMMLQTGHQPCLISCEMDALASVH